MSFENTKNIQIPGLKEYRGFVEIAENSLMASGSNIDTYL
jgi:hypothetical protein